MFSQSGLSVGDLISWALDNASVDNEYKQDHVATVQSAVEDQSESKAEVKANCPGRCA